jgi:carbamoyltransferase
VRLEATFADSPHLFMIILGINAYHGDAAAAIVRDGELIAAVEEERFNRIKHCAGFPTQSIQYCLRAAGIGIEEVDHVGISRDPSAHLHKKVLMAATQATKGIVGRGQSAGGRRPEAGSRRRDVLVSLLESGDASGLGATPGTHTMSVLSPGNDTDRLSASNGNGNGHGFARQLADRLRNAAKVHDLKDDLARGLGVSASRLRARFHNIEHHRAHLSSSFFVSPFERAALLSLDGFGDFISTMWGIGEGNSVKVLGQVEYPHSLGIVYTATTQFLGFPHYGDEGKVMGLASYGRPRFIGQFRDLIRTEKKGQFRLNLDYFRHAAEGVDMTWNDGSPKIGRIFSGEYVRQFGRPREPNTQLTDRESDLAASLQLRLEEVAFHVLNHLHDETGLIDLGLSGGVAYNSVMNGKILLHTPFRRVFIQPAAGDSGTALGVCYQILSEVEGQRAKGKRLSARGEGESAKSLGQRANDALRFAPCPLPFTGPEFTDEEISKELQISNLKSQISDLKSQISDLKSQISDRTSQISNLKPQISDRTSRSPDATFVKYSDSEVTKLAARDIADGLIVGWFQGRMEFGPRALGNRSIVADPRRAEMKDILNQRIKKREPFRPFAPSILKEHVGDYFEQTHPAPTMLMVYQIKPERRAEIPAVTHVDGSGRLQTVSREENARFYQLIQEFYKLTGVPVVLNTSFNENEPIVCTPRDAIDCFLKMRMDVLYIGNHVVRRK